MPIDQVKLKGRIRNDGILHFNEGARIDWRKVGSPYWQAFYFQMRSTSNTIRLDPNYLNYFTASTVVLIDPIGASANTCVVLVSGSQYGRVYTMGNSTGGRIFNPSTNTFTTIPQVPTGPTFNPGPVQTCVLLYDGRVVNIPATTVNGDSRPMSIFDPTTNDIRSLAIPIQCRNGSQAPDYWASIMLPNPPGTTLTAPGSVFMPPYSGTLGEPDTGGNTGQGLYPAIYDIAGRPGQLTLIKTTPYNDTNAGFATALYRDCCLLPSGRIFMVPYNATKAAIYDPQTRQTIFIESPTPPSGGVSFGSGRYYHGVTLNDGRVFLGRYNALDSRSLIYNEQNNTFFYTATINARLRKPILLPDGRVLCIPFARTTSVDTEPLRTAIYDPYTDTSTTFDITDVTSSGGTPTNTSDFFRAAAMLFDGKVFVPIGSANKALKMGSINQSFDWNILASPYHNGR